MVRKALKKSGDYYYGDGLKVVENPSDFRNPDRALISAILIQAFCDAGKSKYTQESAEARLFINKNNILFCYYCDLLEINPEYVAEKMHAALRPGFRIPRFIFNK